jgi:hypothetical protein
MIAGGGAGGGGISNNSDGRPPGRHGSRPSGGGGGGGGGGAGSRDRPSCCWQWTWWWCWRLRGGAILRPGHGSQVLPLRGRATSATHSDTATAALSRAASDVRLHPTPSGIGSAGAAGKAAE